MSESLKLWPGDVTAVDYFGVILVEPIEMQWRPVFALSYSPKTEKLQLLQLYQLNFYLSVYLSSVKTAQNVLIQICMNYRTLSRFILKTGSCI